MKQQHFISALIIISFLLLLSSCAPGGYTSNEYGFFSGVVHGFVFVFALIGKLFGSHYGLYAEHNTGFFYWLGFIIGLGIIGGGGRGAASRR